jgi:hypothetical protein
MRSSEHRSVETGHFSGFPQVTCGMVGEHTLCGDAFDAASHSRDLGKWAKTGASVNCALCREVILDTRAMRLSPKPVPGRSVSNGWGD